MTAPAPLPDKDIVAQAEANWRHFVRAMTWAVIGAVLCASFVAVIVTL